jgi:hypothetical protein
VKRASLYQGRSGLIGCMRSSGRGGTPKSGRGGRLGASSLSAGQGSPQGVEAYEGTS